MILPSSLFFFLKEGERAASCDLRWMQGLIAAVALAMARRTVRRSVQTTSRTDQVCGAKPR